MKRKLLGVFIATLLILSNLSMPVFALTIHQQEIQAGLDERLGAAFRSRKKAVLLLPGTTVHPQANHLIRMEGTVQIRVRNKRLEKLGIKIETLYQIIFTAEGGVVFKNRGLYPADLTILEFHSEIVPSPNAGFIRKGLAKWANKALATQDIDRTAPNAEEDNFLQKEVQLHVLGRIQSRPFYVLDGSKPWHTMALNAYQGMGIVEDAIILYLDPLKTDKSLLPE